MDAHSSLKNDDEKEGEPSESRSDPTTSSDLYKDSAGYENVITANENTTANETITAYEENTAYETSTAYEVLLPYEEVISTDSSRAVQGSWDSETLSSGTERRDENLEDPEKLCKRNISKLLDVLNTDCKGTDDLDLKGDYEENVPLGGEDENLNTEKLCKLIITGVLEADTGSNEKSIDTLDLKREIQKLQKAKKEKLRETASRLYYVSQKLMELLEDQTDDGTGDVYLSSIPSQSYEASIQENEFLQDLPKYEAPEDEFSSQFLKVPPRFQAEDTEIMSHPSTSEETPSVSARQPKEEDISSEKETTCFNFRSICCCFRKWFSSSPRGRKHPKKATQAPPQTPSQTPTEQAPKKRCTRKNKKITPE